MEGIKFEKVSLGTFIKPFEKYDYLKHYVDRMIKWKYTEYNNMEFIKYLYDNIKLPERKTSGSPEYDIEIPLPYFVISSCDKIMDNYLLPSGLKAKMPSNVVLQLYPRSSIGLKYNIGPSNTVAIIDSDYYNNGDNEGHIFVPIKNTNNDSYVIPPENKNTVQGIFIKYETTEDDSVTNIIREGGFGSTNK